MSTPPGRYRRLAVLLVVFAALCALVLFDKTNPPVPVAAAVRAAPGAQTQRPPEAPAAKGESLELLVPRSSLATPQGRLPTDLFRTPAWLVKPVVVAAPRPLPPPPEPVPDAPAPNYRFIGKKEEAGTWEVYLGRDEQNFIVREGQMLESTWRIDRIAPPTLVLTHLPTGKAQTIAIGDVQ